MSYRVTTKRGFNIPSHQHNGDFAPAKTETVIIPSTTQPQFGSMCVVDIKETNLLVHNLVLQMNVSAITVMTSGMFVPSAFWIDHIDYVINGSIIDTVYPLDQCLKPQLFYRDEDRALLNQSQGAYNSTAQRIAMATSANSYYLNLQDCFRQASSTALLENVHNVQLRIFFNPLANITAGTGVATATFNSLNLLMKCTRLREAESNCLRMELAKKGSIHNRFCSVKPQTFPVNSGVSSVQQTLSAITGPVAMLAFVVRPLASLIGNNAYQFTAISSFEIMNSSAQNLVGGQPISNSQALLINGNEVVRSSYLTETALGTVDNKANVYCYSFAADACDAVMHGVSSGVYQFTGNESIKINFAGSLAAGVQIDVLAFEENVLEINKGSAKKRQYHN